MRFSFLRLIEAIMIMDHFKMKSYSIGAKYIEI